MKSQVDGCLFCSGCSLGGRRPPCLSVSRVSLLFMGNRETGIWDTLAWEQAWFRVCFCCHNPEGRYGKVLESNIFALILFSWTYIQKTCVRHSSVVTDYYSCLQYEFIKWAFVRPLLHGQPWDGHSERKLLYRNITVSRGPAADQTVLLRDGCVRGMSIM